MNLKRLNRNNIRTKVILSAALLHYSGYTSILKTDFEYEKVSGVYVVRDNEV